MGQGLRRHPSRGLTERQDKFVRLIAQGVSNAEACRMVGVNRRTGTRWCFGRSVLNTAGEAVEYPPVCLPTPPKPRHPRYLSLAERNMIADLRREQRTVRQIAAEIGRSPSTVSRELRRNADQSGRYFPRTADRIAADRLPRPRERRLLADVGLRAVWCWTCSAGGGVPNRSPTSCASASATSRTGAYAPSRSTGPSTTPTCPSRDRRSADADAGDAESRAWSGVGG